MRVHRVTKPLADPKSSSHARLLVRRLQSGVRVAVQAESGEASMMGAPARSLCRTRLTIVRVTLAT